MRCSLFFSLKKEASWRGIKPLNYFSIHRVKDEISPFYTVMDSYSFQEREKIITGGDLKGIWKKLLTMDSLGLMTLKNTAKCDNSCEMRNCDSRQILNAHCNFGWIPKLTLVEGLFNRKKKKVYFFLILQTEFCCLVFVTTREIKILTSNRWAIVTCCYCNLHFIVHYLLPNFLTSRLRLEEKKGWGAVIPNEMIRVVFFMGKWVWFFSGNLTLHLMIN